LVRTLPLRSDRLFSLVLQLPVLLPVGQNSLKFCQ
jgi:hypothetical protein